MRQCHVYSLRKAICLACFGLGLISSITVPVYTLTWPSTSRQPFREPSDRTGAAWPGTPTWQQQPPVSAQISGSQLFIENGYCDLDLSGTSITSMRLDGTGSGNHQSDWLSGTAGFQWVSADGFSLQPSGGTWENVTSSIPGGATTDGVYRLVTLLGGTINATTTIWLNDSRLTVDYSFEALATTTILKDGWVWIFNETLDKWSPSLVDAVWSVEGGGGRFFMTMHQMMRRPFHYIWGQGSDTYWYQGKGSAGATVEFHVPAQDRAHLFLNDANRLSIATYPWDVHTGASPSTIYEHAVMNRTFTITVHPQGNLIDNAPADYPRFAIDTAVPIGEGGDAMDYGDALTRFFWERVYTYPAGADGTWIDWSSSEFAWNTARFLEETKRRLLNDIPITDGHVSSWNWLDGWPFPDDDSDMNNKNFYDTRHTTTNPNFITAAWRIWQWTGDDAWLLQLKPRLYAITDFFVDMLLGPEEIGNPARVASVDGAIPLPAEALGLLFCDWEGHHGASGGIGNNYWDIQPFGWLDSYANALAYGALLSLADIEQHWGNASLATTYLTRAALLRESYTKLFWDDIFGRFIACVDAWGNRHDYGFTFINQQAAFYGIEWGAPLVDTTQVFRMYDWMEEEPTSSGSKDTFSQWVYAARANTDINSRHAHNRTVERDWWVAQGQAGDAGYRESHPWPWAATREGQLQNGGCSVYTSFHDLMARVYHVNSDDGEARVREILNRWVLPDHICGGAPLYRGELPQQENAGAVGTDYPFPESGLVPTFLVYGLMGMVPRWKLADGSSGLPAGHVLAIDPALPTAWTAYSANNLQFGGTVVNVSVNATAITLAFKLPVPTSLQLEVNDTRHNISSVIDGNGRVVFSWNARGAELQRHEAKATTEHAARLASGRTINATGDVDLPAVPSVAGGATLADLQAWWQHVIQLMTPGEYTAITTEIGQLEASTSETYLWLLSGDVYTPHINRQREEARASLSRGSLRWMLGNYRQAQVIAARVEELANEAMPGMVLQYFAVPAMAIVAVVVILYDAWKGRKAGRGVA